MASSDSVLVRIGNFINEATYHIDVVLRIIMATLLGLIFLQLIAQVVLRYFIRIPLSWIE